MYPFNSLVKFFLAFFFFCDLDKLDPQTQNIFFFSKKKKKKNYFTFYKEGTLSHSNSMWNDHLFLKQVLEKVKRKKNSGSIKKKKKKKKKKKIKIIYPFCFFVFSNAVLKMYDYSTLN